MREILFRGKSEEDGEWLYGLPDDEHHNADFPCILPDWRIHSMNDVPGSWGVDPETVGQFTGLTDKNGKKIFEGDICRIENHHLIDDAPYVVEWEEFVYNGWVWRDLDSDGTMDSFNNSAAKHCEIIGNIHDNPELLKGE